MEQRWLLLRLRAARAERKTADAGRPGAAVTVPVVITQFRAYNALIGVNVRLGFEFRRAEERNIGFGG